MDINDDITDLQQARAIIEETGETYQKEVINMLGSLTYYHGSEEYEKQAQKVIENMEAEYALNTANVLWKDKFEKIPQYLKTW